MPSGKAKDKAKVSPTAGGYTVAGKKGAGNLNPEPLSKHHWWLQISHPTTWAVCHGALQSAGQGPWDSGYIMFDKWPKPSG